jgi:hypothetical protein
MIYNRTEAATAMLSEIEAWCARTSTPEGTIGHVLFLHPGFVGLMRKRLTLSEEKEIAVRAFLYHDYPEGYRGELPDTHAGLPKPSTQRREARENAGSKLLSADEIVARRVDRDACLRCGVRHDIGCKHSRAPVGMMM